MQALGRRPRQELRIATMKPVDTLQSWNLSAS